MFRIHIDGSVDIKAEDKLDAIKRFYTKYHDIDVSFDEDDVEDISNEEED
jgi:hypothetical protein